MPKKYTFIDLYAGTSALSADFVNQGCIPLDLVRFEQNGMNNFRLWSIHRFSYKVFREHEQVLLVLVDFRKEIRRHSLKL